MANVLGCDIVICEFEIQSHHKVHFRTTTTGKRMNSNYATALGSIVQLLTFYQDNFGIK